MDHAAALRAILSGDPLRWRVLDLVRSVGLPDGWVGAGFVRNAVWDHLHRRPPSPPSGDVDVLWFDPDRTDPLKDARLEAVLRGLEPSLNWSVRNQARMHLRNGDGPYASVLDAMRHWSETATAAAVRRASGASCEVAAPFVLDDLFGLVLRPTPQFARERHEIYSRRLETKGWMTAWPLLRAGIS